MPDPSQIRDDLRGVFRGRLRFDPVSRGLFATDASPFEVVPLGVATPRDEPDLAALVKYAHEAGVPLVPRGAGTGLAGEALGPGLVVDLSVGFRDPPAVHTASVTTGVGLTHAELNAVLAPHGRRFAPDPASSATCTVGGMVATDASGGNAVRHGYTRDHVLGLRVVWDNGESDYVGKAEGGADKAEGGRRKAEQDQTATKAAGSSSGSALRPPPSALSAPPSAFRTVEIRAQAAALLARHRELIEHTRPATRFNRCGYALHGALTEGGLDLTRLLVGSEGTLAFVTAATLRTVPVAGGTALAVLGVPTLEAGVRAGLALKAADGLAGCDLLDARQLAHARAGKGGDGIGPLPADVAAALVVTFEADSERAVLANARAAVDGLRGGHTVAVLAEPACDPDGVGRIRRFRERGVAGLYAVGPGPRPLAFVEDAAVPAQELPRFVAGVQQIFRRFDLPASLLVHIPAGQVHARPFVDLASADDRAKMWPLAEAVHGLALALGGTISSQHGTGLARTPWVERQYGPLLPVFRELKRVFDPANILNPGKVVGPDPSRPAWPLRAVRDGASGERQGAGEEGVTTADRAGALTGSSSVLAPRPLPLAPSDVRTPLLIWPTDPPAAVAAACNGCGDCRARAGPTRMCPAFHAVGDEAASPRGMANVMRRVLAPEPAADPLGTDDVRAVAGLCVNCKMCRSECRAGVDVPKLMIEAKAAAHAERGLDRGAWVQARVEGLSAFAGNFAFTANRLLGNRAARWAMEKLFGLSRRRTLPRFTHRTFLRRAKRAGLSQRQGGRRKAEGGNDAGFDVRLPPSAFRLAYFVDVYANYNDPLIGEAAVAVLRRNGFEVYVPPRQRGCGMSALAQGDLDTARDAAAHNVRLLADLVRDGYHVVCSEPAAALALTQDYLDLLDDPDAKLVAANTSELTAFLWGLHEAGRLRTDFRRLDVTLGHHVPCHVKALRGDAAGPKLLGLIPGVRVRTIDVSCSGMAGAWGLSAENYGPSLAVGRPMLAELERPGVLYGSTECGTCRMQMQEGSRKRALHPVQYLALAYGLVPEIGDRLLKPLGTLVTD